MTTATAGKTTQQRAPSGPSTEDLQKAYQIHTLAQMVYSQLAATHPWMAPMPPMMMGPQPYAGPFMGATIGPWAPTSPPPWGYPVGMHRWGP